MDDFDLIKPLVARRPAANSPRRFTPASNGIPYCDALFPGKALRCAIEEFTAFLAQFLGGSPEDAQRRWWLSLRESHLRFKIGDRERDAWMQNSVIGGAHHGDEDAVALGCPALSDGDSATIHSHILEYGCHVETRPSRLDDSAVRRHGRVLRHRTPDNACNASL